ncbi:MAG: YiiX/YebB-like N1pC/P60 family cysteine hydrolase, partial [Shewanella sp.]
MKMKLIRELFFKLTMPFTQWWGSKHWPLSKKELSEVHLRAAQRYLLPGDVFLTRTNGEFSNLLIPGFWKHAAIAIDSKYVVEAVGMGVRITTIEEFLYKKDHMAIMRPKFALQTQMEQASAVAQEMVGKPYDLFFQPGADAFFCSELVQFAYEQVLGQSIPFTKRKTFGVLT